MLRLSKHFKEDKLSEKQETVIETGPEKQKWCPKCKAYYPADEEHFYKDGRSTNGLSSWCRECQRAKRRVNNKKTPVARVAVKPSDQEGIITLDFSGDQDLLEDLLRKAKDDRRTPDQQVMWLLERQLDVV